MSLIKLKKMEEEVIVNIYNSVVENEKLDVMNDAKNFIIKISDSVKPC